MKNMKFGSEEIDLVMKCKTEKSWSIMFQLQMSKSCSKQCSQPFQWLILMTTNVDVEILNWRCFG